MHISHSPHSLSRTTANNRSVGPWTLTAVALIAFMGSTASALAQATIDGLAETVPTDETTSGLVLRGKATWPTSDRDYLNRSTAVLPAVASLGFWHFPDVDFERPDRVGGGRFGVSEFVAESPLYITRLGDTAVLALRFNYELTLMDSGVPGLGDGLELHRLELPTTVSWQPAGSQWRFFTRASVFAKTDFDASWSEAVGYSALVGGFRRVTDSLSLGVGAYYDYSFGEHRFIPGPGFVWAPNDFFSAGLIGPWLQTNWRINENWRLRLEGRWRSQDWVVGNSSIGGDNTQVELRNVRTVAALERKIFEPFGTEAWLSLQVGYRFLTRLEVRDSERRDLFREDLDNGLFFGAAIRVNL